VPWAAVFKGTEAETLELLAATENSCAAPDKCAKDLQGRLVKMCAAHRALMDQRFLDGILWTRRNLAVRQHEEFD
jgi:hypothetical protein